MHCAVMISAKRGHYTILTIKDEAQFCVLRWTVGVCDIFNNISTEEEK